ncbi:hypothetical protein Tco_0387511, partial [Tanacetum coccineum]
MTSNEKVNTNRVNGINTARQAAVSAVKGYGATAVKTSACCVWRPKKTDLNNTQVSSGLGPQEELTPLFFVQ